MKNPLTPMHPKEANLGFAFLFIQLFGIPLIVITASNLLPQPLSIPWQNFLCFALNFLCAIGIFYRYWIRSVKLLENNAFRLLSYGILYSVLSYAGTILINLFVFSLVPDFSNANDSNIASMTEDHYILMLIGTVILVPPVEEVLYRGVLFGQLYKCNPLLGYLVSIIAFASIHVIGYIGKLQPLHLLLSLLQYIPAGLCLARAYEKSGSIFAPILMHAIINFIGIHSM